MSDKKKTKLSVREATMRKNALMIKSGVGMGEEAFKKKYGRSSSAAISQTTL